MGRFVPVDRQTQYLLAPSVQEWLPEDHLARFVVEVLEQTDLGALERAYAGRGSAAHHPQVLLGLLIYGYASGVFSSRAIERATHDSVAFRYIAANTHPDHDTIASFRRRFGAQVREVFLQVLLLAQQMKLLKLGTVALDGTKLKANASRHKALSQSHADRLEQQLSAEVNRLLARAERADGQERRSQPMDLPGEIARREQRLEAIRAAKAQIEQRAKERFEREQAAYEAKRQRRERQRQAGKKPRGVEPKPPEPGPRPKDQVNLTDADSRIMPVAGGGFDQAYNAQIAVDTESLLIVGTGLTHASVDQQQLEPMLEQLETLPQSLGQVNALLADAGYCSKTNVEACVQHKVEPLIALRREQHHLPLEQRFAADAKPPALDADSMIWMAWVLSTQQGRARYARRKSTVEPSIGIIKRVMRFRQFLLRGLAKVSAEWNLVALAYNLRRLCELKLKRSRMGAGGGAPETMPMAC
jgi:transposase